MRAILARAAVCAAWLIMAANAHAYIGLCCAKCGGNMPMDIPGGGVPETYEFRLKIQPVFSEMPGLRKGTTNLDPSAILGMPAMGYYMAAPEKMTMRMLNLALGYSLSERWFVGAMAMWMDMKMPMRFNRMMQMRTGRAGFTMQARGFADTMLMAKRLLYADDVQIPSEELSLFLGLSIPTGSITKRNTTHPMPMRRKELLPYPMQLGSGTWDPSVGLLWQQARSPWWRGVDLRYTTRLGKNSQGWARGDVLNLDAYLMYQPHYAFVLYGEANLRWEGKLRGEAEEARLGRSGHATIGDPRSPYTTPLWDPRNYGRTTLAAALGVQWQPKPLVIVDLGVRAPVYERVRGVQMRTGVSAMLTLYFEIPTAKSIRAQKAADATLGF